MTTNKSKFSKETDTSSKEKPNEDSSIFEKVVPEGIKRGFENILRDGRFKSVLGELKLPKEIINHILTQVDETKHSALGVISREVRMFLERTNLSDELAKLLTQISFEITTNVRFKPNEKAIRKKAEEGEEQVDRGEEKEEDN